MSIFGRSLADPLAMTVASLAFAITLLVAGCDKDRCDASPAQTATSPDPFAEIRKAAEASIRVSASNPDSVRFRGEQVWPQAIRNQFAVCGQANVFGPSSNTFVLFVAVVTRDEFNQDPARRYKVEPRVGSTVNEATRSYIDTLGRCFENGGPLNTRRETVTPVPPLPDDMKAVLAPPPAEPPPVAPAAAAAVGALPPATQAAAASSPAAGTTVIVRQNANIRSSPQGGVLRVEHQGTELHVFGEAPGGWLQVGDGAAEGWIHSSMVQRR